MIGATVTPKRADVYTALRALLRGIIPDQPPPEVIIGLGNRVPMPNAAFICITAIATARLDTNVDTDFDGYPALPGVTNSLQATRMDLQFDFYGRRSNSWATMVSTLFRDDYSCELLAPTCQPFYADDPLMMPLITEENQYLERWTVTAAIQYNPVTVTAQDFSTTLDIVPINVDEEFPPA